MIAFISFYLHYFETFLHKNAVNLGRFRVCKREKAKDFMNIE